MCGVCQEGRKLRFKIDVKNENGNINHFRAEEVIFYQNGDIGMFTKRGYSAELIFRKDDTRWVSLSVIEPL